MDKSKVYLLIEEHYKRKFKDQVKGLSHATGGYHNAEDTVQEAYTRACKYWNTYDQARTFDAWFQTILSNCVRDKQRDSVLNGMVQEAANVMADPPTGDVTNRIYLDEVVKKMMAYPKHVAYVLKMYLLLGYTSKEIAEFTDYKPENIRQIVTRFRQEVAA